MLKVSVIVPVYKVEKYIERCARSLFEQTLEDIEFIFVNDDTPDNSMEIVRRVLDEFPHRVPFVKFINHTTNQGLTQARNSGLSVAVGEYIAHCDSDDWVQTTMYKDLYECAISNNADVVLCDIKMIYKDNVEIFRTLSPVSDNIQNVNDYISLPWNCTVNMIVKRDVYRDHNILCPDNIVYCEDFHLTVRLLYFSNVIKKLDKALYCYNRTNECSITHQLNSETVMDRSKCDKEIISFFLSQGVLDKYEKSISSRVLKYMQYWIDDKERWEDVRSFYPPLRNHISQTKGLIFWRKVVMWNLFHGLYLIPSVLYSLQKLKLKLLNYN